MYLTNIRRKHVAGGTITRRSVATAVVTLPQNSYTYTGDAISPLASVRLDGALLSANEDYTVSYLNNTDIGLATVVITGIGDFYGTAVAEFYIVSAKGGWRFDMSKIEDSPTFSSFTDSAFVGQICPSGDESMLLVATGGGRYVRAGTISNFDPSTWSQMSITTGGANAGTTLFTPDGIHYLYADHSSQYLYMYTGTVAYDVSTLSASPSSSLSLAYVIGGAISSDGRHLLVASYYSDARYLNSYDLQTAWDLSSATNKKYTTTSGTFGAGPICLNPNDPSELIVASSRYETVGGSSAFVRKVSLVKLANEWDASDIESVSTKVFDAFSGIQRETDIKGVAVNKDGSRMILTLTNNSAGYAALVNLSA